MRIAGPMLKRSLDLLAATTVLLAFSPMLLALAVLVRVGLGHPVLFKQLRPGRGGKPFLLIKFRTMRHPLNENGEPLSDADRMTPLGSLLRATSLDELPGLVNVFRGEMSLVGPRPLLMQYLPLYSPEQARRHDVRPGLTGWAQVNGRNTLTWEQKFELDCWYIDNRTFLLDLKILAMTVRKVVFREGISAPGEATMPAFTGQSNS